MQYASVVLVTTQEAIKSQTWEEYTFCIRVVQPFMGYRFLSGHLNKITGDSDYSIATYLSHFLLLINAALSKCPCSAYSTQYPQMNI